MDYRSSDFQALVESVVKPQAIAEYPNEAVWFLTSSGLRKVANVSKTPEKTFEVSAVDTLSASKEGLLAVLHSHTDWYECPSLDDMVSQSSSGVPWGIVATDGKSCTDVQWFGEQVEHNLMDRHFVHGVTDCYGLIKDWYLKEMSIKLREFPREWEWWILGGDLYSSGFSKAGFIQIDESEVKEGDVWLCQIRSDVPNHGGILLKDSLCLHHPSAHKPVDKSRLPRVEPINRYRKFITHWLRYNG